MSATCRCGDPLWRDFNREIYAELPIADIIAIDSVEGQVCIEYRRID